MSKEFYRYESIRWSVCVDYQLELFKTSPAKLQLITMYEVQATPKGRWLSFFKGGEKDRWISNTSRKRYAHSTKEEAMEAYRQRKLAYVRHSKARLKRAEEDLALYKPEGEAMQKILAHANGLSW